MISKKVLQKVLSISEERDDEIQEKLANVFNNNDDINLILIDALGIPENDNERFYLGHLFACIMFKFQNDYEKHRVKKILRTILNDDQ